MQHVINISTSHNLSAVTHPLASSALLPRRLKNPELRRFLLTLHCTCLHPAVLLAERAKVTAKVAEVIERWSGMSLCGREGSKEG